jgi:hypothetical protein
VTTERPTRAFGIRDAVPFASSAIEKFGTAVKFAKTWWFIARGAPLWDKEPEEIEKLGLLTAWKFNLFQSVISASIAAAVVNGVGFFLAPEGWNSSVFNSFASGLIVPLTLAINALFAGYAAGFGNSLYHPDVQRLVRAFLYYDGTAGIVLQTITSPILSVQLALPELRSFEILLGWWPFFVVLLAVNTYVTQIAIPSRLFALTGVNRMSFRRSATNWFRFQIITVLSTACALNACLYLFIKIDGWTAVISYIFRSHS